MNRTEEDVFQKKVSTQPAFGLFEQEAFAVPTAMLRGMVRGDSPIESQVAAARVRDKLTWIQSEILAALGATGPLNARQIEQLPVFAARAPSTVRKRVSELYQARRIVQHGRANGMATWTLA